MKQGNDNSTMFLGWLVLAILAFVMAASMTGCNTVRGVAQAVKGVAMDIEEAANGIQHQMAETDR